MNRPNSAIIGGFLLLLSVLFFCWATSRHVAWKQNVEGRLKRAANASSVAIALKEIQYVTRYLEANQLTQGDTAVLYRTPDSDIGYWYANLKECELSLSRRPLLHTEENIVLLKLRQIILDQDEKGEVVTQPGFIAYHPNEGLFFFGMIFALTCFFAACFCGCMAITRD